MISFLLHISDYFGMQKQEEWFIVFSFLMDIYDNKIHEETFI